MEFSVYMKSQSKRLHAAAIALIVAAFALVTGCSSVGEPTATSVSPGATPTDVVLVVETATPVPTATSTPISAVEPYPTSSPTSTPAVFPPMEVVWLSAADFGEPVVGTVYEELLARLPDNEWTRAYAKLSDYAGVLDFLGIERPEPGATEEDIEPFLEELSAAWQTGFGPDLPAWPLHLRDYLSITKWFPYVAFDAWTVDQSAHGGSTFISSFSGGSNGQRQIYDIAFGRFNPDETADALADCECDQPTVNIHEGVEYYSWSEKGQEFIGEIQRRHGPPFYDHVGRGPQLLVKEGEAYYAILHAVMQEMIDVSAGDEPSLVDDPAYTVAVRRLASLGLMRDMTFYSSGLSLEEALAAPGQQSNNPALFEETVRMTDLFEPFDMVATGIGFDGERVFTGFVISNPDEATASRNAEIFAERLRTVPTSVRSDETYGDQLKLIEIAVEDNLVIGRAYFHDVNRHSFGFPLPLSNTWLIYE